VLHGVTLAKKVSMVFNKLNLKKAHLSLSALPIIRI